MKNGKNLLGILRKRNRCGMRELFYRTNTLECIARNTLTQYDPAYLNRQPQSVPLEQIVENVFKLNIDYMRLTIAGEELGRMIYDDGYSTRYNPEIDNYELVRVKAGTVLIESSLLKDPILYGRYRFTLAHELAHWILHKKIYMGTYTAAATYGYTADDSIEWQADYLAKAILMPVGQIKRGFYQLQTEHTTRNKIVKLAELFEVSKQAMEIRLSELGLIK